MALLAAARRLGTTLCVGLSTPVSSGFRLICSWSSAAPTLRCGRSSTARCCSPLCTILLVGLSALRVLALLRCCPLLCTTLLVGLSTSCVLALLGAAYHCALLCGSVLPMRCVYHYLCYSCLLPHSSVHHCCAAHRCVHWCHCSVHCCIALCRLHQLL